MVSEKYLQDLQKQVELHQRSSSVNTNTETPFPSAPPPYRSTSYCSPSGSFSSGIKRTSDSAFGVGSTLSSPALTVEQQQSDSGSRGLYQQQSQSPLSIWPSAFTIPSKIIKNTRKNRRTWIWLAPWSTWSFTLRLMLMLGDSLQPGGDMIPPQLIESDVYTLSWNIRPPHEKPDVTGLPSLDYAIYLFHTFKFHLGQTYRLFDEVEFVNQIRDFYSDAQSKAEENRLWYVKFLLILAFGTAFNASQRVLSTEPPGSKFFVRAMGLMPDHTALWKDSLLAIEVLAMVGLYLYSIDERESAHVYCVIVATRPLLLSVLKERLDILGQPGDENSEAFLGQTAAVISTGIKSAVKTLQILTSEYSLLEVFLPYDLEFTFGAALHLNMATALFPGVADDQNSRLQVHQLLDNMIARGNRLASVRKQELVYLEAQCQELVAQVQQQGLQTLSLAVTDETDSELARKADEELLETMQGGSDLEFLDNIGISSEEFMSIVQQIGDPDIMPENMLTLE
ncbi:c6 transcription factor [Fusarium flagelliforme]|uniref:C6 transcription factor n=1 Tax=Fusarium flagelliforme TaxID=2675880 RepID=A0A395N139_9HYPO|nr:c6 transcription factor [Fusarium flagelliforme]